ncbi:MAG: cysteine synthase A [Eubacteriales bacterium]
MTKIYNNITELIGHTPILELNRMKEQEKLQARVVVKIEAFNPAGSIKDRAAFSMIKDAEEKGILSQGDTIIEPTSGNTGIGLASIAAARGYKTVFTMPETMSVERRLLLKAYGAEIVLTDGKLGMNGAIQEAKRLSEEANMVLLGQFVNPSNAKAHFMTTGPEIWEDTDGKVDVLVAGIGTGGTITGTGRYLKEKNSKIKVVAVEPSNSPVLSGGQAGPHGLMGIGAGFVPEILDTTVYDEVVTVENEQAYNGARKLAKEEGVLVGITSGAALHVAIEMAKKEENKGKMIVVVLPDTGERYLSTPLYTDIN